MYRTISRDVKIAAIKLFERHLLSLDDILDCCGFSERTWYRVIKLWRATGDVLSDSRSLRGRLRILDHDDIHYLTHLIYQNPDYFLDELLQLLKVNRFISANFNTIHRELLHARVSRKRLQRIAIERNGAKRAEFIARMAQYSPEELGFIDEVSKDERTVGRRYGRSKKGCRAKKQQPFVRGRRTSTVGVLSLDGFVSGTSVEGSLTKATFLQWLEFSVLIMVSLLPFCVLIAFSSRNAVPILAHSASSCWTMQKYITMRRFWSSSIDSAFDLSTCHHICRISIPLRRLSLK
jgi:hypothetical protein